MTFYSGVNIAEHGIHGFCIPYRGSSTSRKDIQFQFEFIVGSNISETLYCMLSFFKFILRIPSTMFLCMAFTNRTTLHIEIMKNYIGFISKFCES
jgi:hypothetical protein